MALTDDIQARYSTQRLVELTNPGDVTATTIDTTNLANAILDVEADLAIYAGVTYDGSDARHLSVAIPGVLLKLLLYTNNAGAGYADKEKDWLERVKALARVTSRDRIQPQTNSVLTPTPEQAGVEVVRPGSDRPNFDDFNLDDPQ